METTDSSKLPHSRIAMRKKLFILLGLVILVIAIGVGLYWYFYASHFISTDNAYTATEIAQVTPSTGGTVQEVRVVDTQKVKKGDILVVIEDTDARLALQQAEADEERAQALLLTAEADFAQANAEYKRRQSLIASGAISQEEFTRTKAAFLSTKAAIASAKASIAQAKARADQAKVDFGRTIVKAPVDGIVAKRTVQVGQRVAQGTTLLSVVPIHEMHIDANFKEGQLEKVRTGQKVEIIADIYGSNVVYHGVVEGFSGGTGSAFAIIPAQNATGNWIKVVQRLPVRIRLDPQELEKNPLQVGLSMTVTIDTRESE